MVKISQQLDNLLISKACGALILHEEKKLDGKNSLLGNYSRPLLVQIELVNGIKKPVLRPIRIKIPNSLFSPNDEDHNICFFCKSDDKDDIIKYIDDNPIEGLKTIVSINEVKKLYNAFKDRKKLLSEHTHFVCDSRVMGQLYNLLGKVFLGKNHHPIPIDFKTSEELPNSIKKIVDSTYMHLKGKNIAIRFGHTAMKKDKIVQNIIQGLQFAAGKIPSGGWNNIQNIVLKTPDSAALPIFNKDKEKNNEVSQFIKGKVVENKKKNDDNNNNFDDDDDDNNNNDDDDEQNVSKSSKKQKSSKEMVIKKVVNKKAPISIKDKDKNTVKKAVKAAAVETKKQPNTKLIKKKK